jgi:integral membrane protein (TIGR00529 family)
MIQLFLQVSPTIKVLVVFVLIIVALKFKVPLGIAMVVGAIVVGLWFGMNPVSIVKSLGLSVIGETTLMLILAIALILLLSQSMSRVGQLLRIVTSFRRRFSHYRISLATFPALIGLLPMPGGAYFSAPMIESVGAPGLSPEHKTAINHWFRHIWEYSWPLYPGVIVGSALSGLPTSRFVLVHFPVTLITLGLGFLFLLTRLGSQENSIPEEKDDSSHFFQEILPIIIIVFLSVTVGALLSLAARKWPIALILPDRTALAIALGVGVLWVWRKNRMTVSQEVEVLKDKKLWILIFTILGVMAFRQLLTDSGAVEGITQSLADRQMPMIAISMFLPFFVGMITGVTVAFLATTFPILMALISAQGLESQTVSFTVLAYCSGFMGTFLSPVHLCLILTKEYFKAEWAGIYRLILAPGILTILSALGLYYLYLRLY